MNPSRPLGGVPFGLLLSLLLAFGPLPAAVAADKEESKPKKEKPTGGALAGTIVGLDGKAAGGARLVLLPLEARGPERSTVAGSGGKFSLEGIGRGLYRFLIVHEGKAYIGNRALLIEPLKEAELDFRLDGFQPVDRQAGLVEGQPVPLLNLPASGVGRVVDDGRAKGWAWFRTGAGVTVLVAGGAAVVGGLIALTDSNTERQVSPTVIP